MARVGRLRKTHSVHAEDEFLAQQLEDEVLVVGPWAFADPRKRVERSFGLDAGKSMDFVESFASQVASLLELFNHELFGTDVFGMVVQRLGGSDLGRKG